jgi:hypothetical protein
MSYGSWLVSMAKVNSSAMTAYPTTKCPIKLVLGSGVLRMAKRGVASPLLDCCRRWHLPVVLAVVYGPFFLVEPLLPHIDIHQMVHSLLLGYTVDVKKMLE